jgi:hypothetical protein
LTSNKTSLIDEPEWWKEIPEIYIDDIGEIYNYNYAMYWNAPDEQDYLLSQTPVDVDLELVEEFISFINDFIDKSEDFEPILEEEILFRVSSSKALYKGNSIPQYSEKSNCMQFSTKRKAGKRILITTGPGQGRDAVINQIDDLNTIQIINENVRQYLAKNFRKYLLLESIEKSKRRFFKTCKKSDGFYCRDIKKEGITKPKWILKEILSALHKRYPENVAFHYTDFYDGPWYEGDKGQRGHGLGMANELTTLMQILIYAFTNKKLGDEGLYVVSTKSLFLNDDAIIFFNDIDQDQIDDFVDTDFDICQKLGILAQKDKSFSSTQCGVFCELYYSKRCPSINDKESYLLREQNIILRTGSILEAKFLLGNLKGDLSSVENLLKTAYSKFGYEFSEKEINWPISFGGSRPMKLRGTDFSLRLLEDEKDIKTVFRAYEANKNRRLWSFNKFLKKYKPPILQFYPQLIYEDEELISKIGIVSDFDLACMFFRPTKEHKFHRSIERLRKKRADVFKKTTTAPTFDLLCEDYCQNSLNNVALFPHQIERFIEVKKFIHKDFHDPYKVTNPVASFLNYLKIKKDESIPSTCWGLYQSDASLLNEKSVFARNRTQNTLSLIDRFEEDIDIDLLVFPVNPNDLEDFMESYPKPWLTSELIVEEKKLPIPKKEFRNPNLKRRIEVYGQYLQYHHIILAQSLTWLELRYVILFEKWKPDFKYDVEFWLDVVSAFRQDKKDQNNPSSSSTNSSDFGDDDDDPFKGVIINTISLSEVTYMLDQIEEKEYLIPSDTESDQETEIPVPLTMMEEVQKDIEEKDKNNIFLIKNGPLVEGDESVYGSVGWVKWFVERHPIDLDEYIDADEELNRASIDVLAYKRGISGSHTLESLQQRDIELKDNIAKTVNWSWISFYFNEYINSPEPEEEVVDFDVFG